MLFSLLLLARRITMTIIKNWNGKREHEVQSVWGLVRCPRKGARGLLQVISMNLRNSVTWQSKKDTLFQDSYWCCSLLLQSCFISRLIVLGITAFKCFPSVIICDFISV